MAYNALLIGVVPYENECHIVGVFKKNEVPF